MADRINYHAALPNAKIVIWAHSAHIAKYAWLDKEIGLMGATVQKKFPTDYIAIGMSGGQGSYSFIKIRNINNDHNFTDSLFTGRLHPGKAGSWNELLLKNTSGNYYLDFSRLSPAERNKLNKKRSIKMLGYSEESDKGKEYYDVSLGKLFDVLIFLKETTQTTALFN